MWECRETLDAMMKRVVSAFSCASVLAMCVPSMFDTNQTRGPPFEYGFRASVTIRGPCKSNVTSRLQNAVAFREHTACPRWSAHQVRPSDAHVDHIRDGLPRVALPLAAAHLLHGTFATTL